ncbi:type II toxin-antitoxin system RelE/ParE family toxin [Telmatospirillum siberiense]|uniref:Peptidase n=1 Tax=Telmatospirillum siberiense TaxID=382514 RepID=A0A2N3PM86_9PROT|nr:type II toxin-antitoxin system RelE/ParE family toxin [Telmatospirillum siberiense]PKU21518.1 peptidase [Telmatospirillum siberiense]
MEFRHKGLRRLFEEGDTRGVSSQPIPKLRRILGALQSARKPEDMDLPGFKLHPLYHDRDGQWAVTVTGNWRVVFFFTDGEPTDIDLVDYH